MQLAPDDGDDRLDVYPTKLALAPSLLLPAASAAAQLTWTLLLHHAVRTSADLATAFGLLPLLFVAGGLLAYARQAPTGARHTPHAIGQGVVLCVLFLLRMHMLHYCGVAFTSLVETAHLALSPTDLSRHGTRKAGVAIVGGYTLALAFSSASTHPPSLLFHLALCLASVLLQHAYAHWNVSSSSSRGHGVVFGAAAITAALSTRLFGAYFVTPSVLPRAESAALSPSTIALLLVLVSVLALPPLVPHLVYDTPLSVHSKHNAMARLVLQVPLTLGSLVALPISLHAVIHAMLSLSALVPILWGLYLAAPWRLPSLPTVGSPAARTIFLFLAGNMVYMVVEFVVGYSTNSLGLWSDAGHMLFDNISLVIGLCAATASSWPANGRFGFGYGRVEVLSGFVNSILLLLMAGHFMAEAIARLTSPPEVHTEHLLVTSIGGLAMNVVGLVWFHDLAHGHSHSDGASCSNSNLVGVYLHVLADTLGSVGVIVSSLCIDAFGWLYMDPLCSGLISVLVVGSTLPLLKATAIELLQGIPAETAGQLARATRDVETLPGVAWVEPARAWRHGPKGFVLTMQVGVVDHVDHGLLLEAVHAALVNGVSDVAEATVQLVSHRGLPVPTPRTEGCCHDHDHDHEHDHDHDHGHH
ncbi:hypothetical protein SDRG_15729 [Saprolegnia diclina VS20]|uniref:Cation efflux protein transmembrane domain-containing protein n=1 Tax=Saprolegnia diclina (strain VS20) TaxID=1156394 RepID=T0R349_SAPDV|nr:hypothetical protein SDRG_15729 [Saprolegnia diclina VS20]EQC26448.1 hypothetical protein SDRG_15729 [Saprolegnia diclina VS20]|eukprot:XP_008620133.1 hypothetical protein SDRG_15729 [Saprolegnia diclina VS20]